MKLSGVQPDVRRSTSVPQEQGGATIAAKTLEDNSSRGSRFVIDHADYGKRCVFESLQHAVESIRDRGPKFGITEFSRLIDGQIVNEEGEIVGRIER